MQVFGKYRVLERIAQGGMGTLLKAHDSVLDRTVALKLLGGHGPPGDDLRARFFREARAGARLTHPNVVTVHDLGEVDGQLFIVMEFLDGEDLGRLIAARRALTLGARLDLMIQVCDGLAYAHRNGVVHRDLKPANILVTRTGQVKIVDFGIARLTRDATGLTQTGVMMGTLRYMAPEQGRGHADERSDIFSIGAVFHELLTLQPAFPGGDGMEILEALRSHEPPAVNRLDPSIPPELGVLVTEMLRKDPAGRPASVEQVGRRLRAFREHLAEHGEPGVSDDTVSIEQVPAHSRRHAASPQRARSGRKVGAAVGVALVAVAVGAYWLWPVSQTAPQSRVTAVTAQPPDVRALPPADVSPDPALKRPAAAPLPAPERPSDVERAARPGDRQSPVPASPPTARLAVDPPTRPRPVAPAPVTAPATTRPAAPGSTSRGTPPASPLPESRGAPQPAPAPPSRVAPQAERAPAPSPAGAQPGAPAPPAVPEPATPTPAAPAVVTAPAGPGAPAIVSPKPPPSVSPPPVVEAPRTEITPTPVLPPAAGDPPPAQRPAVVAIPPDSAPARPDPAVTAVAGTWKGLMSTRLSEAAVEFSVATDAAGATAALLIHSARHLGAGTIGFHESYAIARHAWPKPLSRLKVDGRRIQAQDADALFALDLELSRDQKNLEGTLTAEGTVYSVHLRRR